MVTCVSPFITSVYCCSVLADSVFHIFFPSRLLLFMFAEKKDENRTEQLTAKEIRERRAAHLEQVNVLLPITSAVPRDVQCTVLCTEYACCCCIVRIVESEKGERWWTG